MTDRGNPDPRSPIPRTLRAELEAELSRARSLGDGVPEAREWAHDARLALGEGHEGRDADPADLLAAAIRALLRHRDGRTICPSDAARVVGGEQWRDLMPLARTLAARLASEGVVRVQQKGVDVDPASARGPMRLAPGVNLGRNLPG